jgi:hypothetical protein
MSQPDPRTAAERRSCCAWASDPRLWPAVRDHLGLTVLRTHQVLSVWFHNPLDPYSTGMRLASLFVSIFTSLASSAVLFNPNAAADTNPRLTVAFYSSVFGLTAGYFCSKIMISLADRAAAESRTLGVCPSKWRVLALFFVTSYCASAAFTALTYALRFDLSGASTGWDSASSQWLQSFALSFLQKTLLTGPAFIVLKTFLSTWWARFRMKGTDFEELDDIELDEVSTVSSSTDSGHCERTQHLPPTIGGNQVHPPALDDAHHGASTCAAALPPALEHMGAPMMRKRSTSFEEDAWSSVSDAHGQPATLHPQPPTLHPSVAPTVSTRQAQAKMLTLSAAFDNERWQALIDAYEQQTGTSIASLALAARDLVTAALDDAACDGAAPPALSVDIAKMIMSTHRSPLFDHERWQALIEEQHTAALFSTSVSRIRAASLDVEAGARAASASIIYAAKLRVLAHRSPLFDEGRWQALVDEHQMGHVPAAAARGDRDQDSSDKAVLSPSWPSIDIAKQAMLAHRSAAFDHERWKAFFDDEHI